jgi:hypothetical protein
MAASAAMNCSGVASQAPATNATHSDPPCIATPARVVTRDHAPGVDGTTAGACAWTSGTAALAKGGVPAGFSLAYQPVVRLPDSTPVAIEALARWTAPNGADIQPDAFVAAAEAAGLGAALDAMVWIWPARSSSRQAGSSFCTSTSVQPGWAARNSSGRSEERSTVAD